MAHKFAHHFTVEEANEMLPFLLSILEKIGALREDMAEHQEELESVHEAAPGNGGGKHGGDMVMRSESIGRLLQELESRGVVVKDPNLGLIDFPHMRDDREVFLCWRMGEKTVEFWHELNAGFKGRQPL